MAARDLAMQRIHDHQGVYASSMKKLSLTYYTQNLDRPFPSSIAGMVSIQRTDFQRDRIGTHPRTTVWWPYDISARGRLCRDLEIHASSCGLTRFESNHKSPDFSWAYTQKRAGVTPYE